MPFLNHDCGNEIDVVGDSGYDDGDGGVMRILAGGEVQ